MGSGYWWLFAGLAIVALVGIFTWLFVYKAALDRWINVALAIVTGGILGNLYDRLGLFDSTGLKADYHHAVRDWILFVWPESGMKMFNPWPNFNIADSLLVTGAIMLVVHALVWRETKDEAGQETGDRKQVPGKHEKA
jgi:signal peptidase II